jgi:hypothetical protein
MVALAQAGEDTMKKYLTIAVAAAALAIGSLSVTTEASARGSHGGGGMRGHGGHGMHGGHFRHGGHGHFRHGHWRHRWGYGFGYAASSCWAPGPYGPVWICY